MNMILPKSAYKLYQYHINPRSTNYHCSESAVMIIHQNSIVSSEKHVTEPLDGQMMVSGKHLLHTSNTNVLSVVYFEKLILREKIQPLLRSTYGTVWLLWTHQMF
jgi:hypothetical protein